MGNDRTGGSGREACVNPPVVSFSEEFSPACEPPKPLDQSELRERAEAVGFVDGDTDQAEWLLRRIGLQHASSYFDLFKVEGGSVADGSSMMELHRVLIFDRKFQALLIEYIGLFELQFRAQYSYWMSERRGAFAHRDASNFKDARKFRDFLKRYQDEFNRQLKKGNPDIVRARETYGDAPIWLAVEIMSFGTLSMLYGNTRNPKVREGVARSFGATSEELVSWTRAISGVRNTCAHFGRLVGTKLTARPKMIPGFKGDNGSPLYIVALLEYLLKSSYLFSDDPELSYDLALISDAMQLFIEYRDELPRCGFPSNWAEYVLNSSVLGAKIEIPEEALAPEAEGEITLTIRKDGGSIHATWHTEEPNQRERPMPLQAVM